MSTIIKPESRAALEHLACEYQQAAQTHNALIAQVRLRSKQAAANYMDTQATQRYLQLLYRERRELLQTQAYLQHYYRCSS